MADHRYCVGSFSRITTTGTQTVTGIADADGSFTPKGVLFWGTVQNGNATAAVGRMFMGMTDGTRAYAWSVYMNTGQSSPSIDWVRTQTFDGAVIRINNDTQTTTSYGTGGSPPIVFADGEFTIDWQVSLDATAFTVNYLVFGGSDLAIVAGSQLDPLVTGPVTVTPAAGIGQITGLITVAVPGITSANYAVPSVTTAMMPIIGCANSTAQGVLATVTDETASYWQQLTNKALARLYYNASGALAMAAEVSSLGVGQFSLNYTTADATGGPYDTAGFFYLAIAGPEVEVGSGVSRTSNGTQTVSLSFTPGAALGFSAGRAASAITNTNVAMSFGVVSPTAQRATWTGVLDGSDSCRARNQSNARFLFMGVPIAPSGSGVNSLADAAATIITDGISLNWTDTDATARQYVYMAFGLASPAPPDPPETTTIPIRWLRQSPTVSHDGKRLFFQRFQVDFQPGTGLAVASTAQYFDPIVYCQTSDDGGFTWSGVREMTLGEQGQYLKQMRLFQLGSSYARVFRIYGDAPVDDCIVQAWLDVTEGAH